MILQVAKRIANIHSLYVDEIRVQLTEKRSQKQVQKRPREYITKKGGRKWDF